MGAQQGNMADPRQRQMSADLNQRSAQEQSKRAREGMRMRRENIRQREAAPQTGEASMFPGVEPQSSEVGAMPPHGGIEFGPGRANRFPEPGSPEYQMAIARMRGGRR